MSAVSIHFCAVFVVPVPILFIFLLYLRVKG